MRSGVLGVFLGFKVFVYVGMVDDDMGLLGFYGMIGGVVGCSNGN